MRSFFYELNEALRIAFTQITANLLRSALTALGVIIGILSVTLMGTAILGIEKGVDRSFANMGEDVFYVGRWPWGRAQDWWVYRNRPLMREEYAQRINDWVAERPDSLLKLAVPMLYRNVTLLREDIKLTNIAMNATDHQWPLIAKADMKEGRFFGEFEVRAARNVLVLGQDIADALFPGQSPIGETLRIGDQTFTIIGVFAKQGGILGAELSVDSKVMIPVTTFRRSFMPMGADIRVRVDAARMDEAREELRGVMRMIRGVAPEKGDNFEINEQRLIRQVIDPIKNNIALGGLVITSLALFVGAINIMNITYVGVKERTKEIGTRKALGARRRTILLQFLIEAMSICVAGGVVGLVSAAALSAVISALVPSFSLVSSLSRS
jgi:putative ABC transport system permease protein